MTAMRPVDSLLLVMNPRRIPECMASLEALPIDQAWLTGYSERDLPINDVIRHTNYDRYTLVSDDALASPGALAAVLAAHDEAPDAVVTGYSNLARGDDRVNLVDQPLGAELGKDAYSLMTREQVQAQPTVFPTWFTGYAFTTMNRGHWMVCPHPGREHANDFYHSHELTAAGFRILAVRDGYVEHVKTAWNEPDDTPGRGLWVGRVPAEVRWRFKT